MTQKVVLITGASSGFGHDLALRLLQQGCRVYAAARRLEPMADLQSAGATLLAMDVCDDASVRAGVDQLLAEAGRLDVVVNNAGYGVYGAVEDVSLDDARHQFEVNVFGMARVNAAVLPAMRRQRSGRILVTASLSSHISPPGTGWYGASKYAIRALCEALRMEVESLGIQVVQIEPGPVKTGFEAVAFEKMDAMPVSDDYRPIVGAFRRYMAASYARAPDMEGTLRLMVKAATHPRPKWVYRTTFESKVIPVLRVLLGVKLFHRILMRVFARYQ